MIDWDGLVLAPVMDIFAQPITVTPTVSQPSVPAFTGRGILRIIDNIDVPLEDGILSSQVITIGVRVGDFAVAPGPGDQVTTGTDTFWIDDTDEDGQGGSIWTMKRTAP